MHVGVIGLGETGATIVALLNEKLRNATINVYDPADWISGRLLDLHHASVYKNNSIVLNNFSQGGNCEYLFFCAGIRNEKGGNRMDMVKQNKAIIKSVFDNLKVNPRAKIIVLTNPVELITEWIYEYLENEFVVGTGTGLDYYRLKFIAARELGVLPIDVDIPVVGEHGSTMLPLFSQGTIQGVSAAKLISPKVQLDLTLELKDSASTIRITEEATKYGVAQCAIDLMESFESKKKTLRFVSYKVPASLQDELKLSYPIFLSLPYAISASGLKEKWSNYRGVQEIAQLNESAKKVEQYYLDFSD
jgi:malate/lactate dehydrogenase